MNTDDIARYHSSTSTAASELAVRKAMTEAGFSDREVDQMFLVHYLQRAFFRRWALGTVAAISVLWLFDFTSTGWALSVAAVAVVVSFAYARIHAHTVAKTNEWDRVKDGWVRR
jgi:hypothetical protein